MFLAHTLIGLKITTKEAILTEGLWDDVDYYNGTTSEKKDIKKYNPNIHIYSSMIDYAKYEPNAKEGRFNMD